MKKIISMLIILTLLLIITACAADESGNIPESTTGAKTDETTAVVQEYKPPNVNYNGAVINIGAMDHIVRGVTLTWHVTKYCDAYAPEQDGDPINDALYLRNQKIEEELGVTIKTYPFQDRTTCGPELQKLIMADEDAVDIAYINGNNLPLFMGNNLVIDFYTISNLDLSHSWWDQNGVKEFELFGKLQVVTGDISFYLQFAPIGKHV
ncbi:MAG: hypothetical protein FWF15_10085 [Oscillospiraceae bacterium]|nr:hypothetical protein [Oscillospiraceae bacterium]